jgi:bifunctional UDP-N-acetylglucosamine pyrophosphorylase/glucosamine-1-phosphate N-acetyltransferase
LRNREFVGIILAAGDSTRMKSETPKVLHPILGRPMLEYIIKSVRGIGIKKLMVVIGFKKEKIVDMFRDFEIEFVTQEERLGTAHAVLQTLPFLEGFDGDCIITCGDTPLISEQTLKDIYEKHMDESADMTLLTAYLDNPTGYGRILRDERGNVVGIIEEKDATQEQRNIKEVNTGIYCFKSGILFNLLDKVGKENQQGEYYLTDCVSLARGEGLNISNHVLKESLEIFGINNRAELALVNGLIRKKKLETLMLNGVTIIDPNATYIDFDVNIGRDTIIYPCVVIEGKTVIGKECVINPFTYIKDLHIGDGEIIGKAALEPFDSSV